MTTTQLLAALARECPNGVSFDPMSLRLLRQKVTLEEDQIENLKTEMFQLGNSLWFSREMISDDDSLLALEVRAKEWLEEHGCFSVERLFEDFHGVLRHIHTPDACAVFLRHLGFTVSAWGKGGHFCFLLQSNLDDSLAEVAKAIMRQLENMHGTLTISEIKHAMPHLAAGALENIRIHFLPEVHRAEVGESPCWRSTESIPLPEDFSEKLAIIIDTLVELEKKVTPEKLEFALSLLYKIHFCKEYSLQDKVVFMRVCEQHYKGGNDAFSSSKKPREKAIDVSKNSKRVRSPNTSFCKLGVPIGAELIFTKDHYISCVVLDNNKVEYEEKQWAISSLVMHLLGVSSANGYCYFSYEGETLWERRLRLESAGKQDGNTQDAIFPFSEV